MFEILEYDEYDVLIAVAEGPGDGWTYEEAISKMHTLFMESTVHGEMHSYKVVRSGHAPMIGSMIA
jgi:hypothetical protein